MVNVGNKWETAESERAVKEAEEARRREIMEKIRQLEEEISRCRSLTNSFRDLEKEAGMIISKVNEYKNLNLETNMNAFFGITAGAVNDGIENAQSVMGERGSDFSNTEAAIETQIGLLESYNMELGSRINRLRSEL